MRTNSGARQGRVFGARRCHHSASGAAMLSYVLNPIRPPRTPPLKKFTLGAAPRSHSPAPGSMRVAAAPARAPRAFVRAPRRGPPPRAPLLARGRLIRLLRRGVVLRALRRRRAGRGGVAPDVRGGGRGVLGAVRGGAGGPGGGGPPAGRFRGRVIRPGRRQTQEVRDVRRHGRRGVSLVVPLRRGRVSEVAGCFIPPRGPGQGRADGRRGHARLLPVLVRVLPRRYDRPRVEPKPPGARARARKPPAAPYRTPSSSVSPTPGRRCTSATSSRGFRSTPSCTAWSPRTTASRPSGS
jgi:hypothetical protein